MGRAWLSDFEKGIIVALRDEGKSLADISSKLGRSRSCVSKFLTRKAESGSIDHAPVPGRPRKTTPRTDRKIVRAVKLDARVSSKEIKEEMELKGVVSDRTIRRLIRESGYRGGWSLKKSFVSEDNKKKRVKWAQEHINWTSEQWRRVIWSDESPYTVRGSTKFRVWRLPNTRYDPKHTRGTVKHSGKINVWGCVSAHGVGTLHLIEGIMDQQVYRQILIHHLKSSKEKLFPAKRAKWIFQQDNDPKHTAKSVQAYLKNKEYVLLDWPSQSPDLNPIENLWAIIEHRLRHRICKNETELFALLKAQWEKLEPKLLTQLVDSMPERCAAVIESRENPTKY